MRYRGGGVGHKYMREIEEKFENMSRERLHGKQGPKPPQANNVDADSTSNSDDSDEPEDIAQPGMSQAGTSQAGMSQAGASQPGVSQAGQAGEPAVDEDLGGDPDGNNSDESDDVDYMPTETDSSDSEGDEAADSDDIGSDLGYDSYGLGDL